MTPRVRLDPHRPAHIRTMASLGDNDQLRVSQGLNNTADRAIDRVPAFVVCVRVSARKYEIFKFVLHVKRRCCLTWCAGVVVHSQRVGSGSNSVAHKQFRRVYGKQSRASLVEGVEKTSSTLSPPLTLLTLRRCGCVFTALAP
jgi:hypothetical protein